jgi:hypothetical protein
MKTYTAKFDRSKKEYVYVLHNNKILKTKIVKTRITDQEDYGKINTNNVDMVSGLKVEYLIYGEAIPQGENSVIQSMDWIDESNVFATKEELIAKID